MIISKKKYEKLNDDLVDAKAKVDDAKKSLDDENKIMKATLLIKEQRDQLKDENYKLLKENEQLSNKKVGLEHALVQANKHIDFLRNELFGSDGE